VHLRRPKLNSRGQVQRRRRDKSRRHAAMAGESRLLVREDTFACAAPERSKTDVVAKLAAAAWCRAVATSVVNTATIALE